jgi:hypothetical protein
MKRQFGRAWLGLCFALGLHVLDEAWNGFLAVYNLAVVAIREGAPWLPLPVFRFETWLAGLAAAIAALFLLSIFAFRGARWMRPAGYAFALLMAANAFGHITATILGRTVESVRLSGPMPGFYSSPLLLAASVWLLIQLAGSRLPTPAAPGAASSALPAPRLPASPPPP